MTHTLIYSPEGEPVEVVTSLVGDLVLNKGWTQSPPTFEVTSGPELAPQAPDDWRDEESGSPAGEEPADEEETPATKPRK